MNYITSPNLPKSKVSVFIADALIPGAITVTPAQLSVLPSSLQYHADLGICVVSENKAVCPPDSFHYYKKVLSPYGFNIISGKSTLASNYPHDSAYNVCIVGKKCFLNKRVCDETLFDILTSKGYEIIEVKQGYTKCSVCPIDENSLITADTSIASAAKKHDMDVLLVSNDKILLSGYSNGFFGGCCGLSAPDTLLINGDAKKLPEFEKIQAFLNTKGIKIHSLHNGNVTDIGSIIPLIAI